MTDTATNKLTTLTQSDLQGSDLIRVFSQKYGANAAASLTVLKGWIDDVLEVGKMVTQYASPNSTAFTVVISASDRHLILTPTAGFAAGTIELPGGIDRGEILVNCTQAITALTMTPATGDTVIGAPTALAANDFFRLKYDGVLNAWYRVG